MGEDNQAEPEVRRPLARARRVESEPDRDTRIEPDPTPPTDTVLPTPGVVTCFRVFCAIVAFGSIVGAGISFLPLTNNFYYDDSPGALEFIGFLFSSLSIFTLFAIPLLFPRAKPWAWWYGLTLILLATLSVYFTLFGVLLLIFWVQPRAQRFFGRMVEVTFVEPRRRYGQDYDDDFDDEEEPAPRGAGTPRSPECPTRLRSLVRFPLSVSQRRAPRLNSPFTNLAKSAIPPGDEPPSGSLPMTRALFATAFALSASFVSAEDAPKLRFVWQKDATSTYQVVQTTTVQETTLDEQTKKPVDIATVTKLTIGKKWVVKSVDTDGGATLEMITTALKQEITQTVGAAKPEVRLLDSTNPADAKAMPFLNKAIFTLKVDPLGKIADVKSENPGAADRLQADLPFKLHLPDAAPMANSAWERAFELKLPPPLGTGEKFDAVQKYTFRGMNKDFAIIGVTSALKTPPEDAALMPAIAPMLWEGDVFFNAKTGQYHGAKLAIKKEIANHQGEGTKFRYTSEYTEALEK